VYKECSSKNVRHKEAVSKNGRVGGMEVYVDRLNEILADAARHGYKTLGYNISYMLIYGILQWFCEKALDNGIIPSGLREELNDFAEEISDSEDANNWTEWIDLNEGFNYDEESGTACAAMVSSTGMRRS